MSEMNEWGPWTDGTWADVQAGDEIDKGERIWYVANVSNGLVDMVPTEDRAGTIRSGRPSKDAPVKYRRRAESEPVNVVTEQRPTLREVATAVLDGLTEVRRAPTELQTKITEIVNGDPAVERAGWIEQEARDTGQSIEEVTALVDEVDPIEQRVIDAAEGMPCAPAPITETEMVRAKNLSAIGELVSEATTRAVGAIAAGYAPTMVKALSALHMVVGEFTSAYVEAFVALASKPEPDAGDMTTERAALANLKAVGAEPLVIERVLSYPDVLKHLIDDHDYEDRIPPLGKRTKIEARKELADLHFAAHEHEQRVGEKWEPRGNGRPHVHPVMDRPMPPGAI